MEWDESWPLGEELKDEDGGIVSVAPLWDADSGGSDVGKKGWLFQPNIPVGRHRVSTDGITGTQLKSHGFSCLRPKSSLSRSGRPSWRYLKSEASDLGHPVPLSSSANGRLLWKQHAAVWIHPGSIWKLHRRMTFEAFRPVIGGSPCNNRLPTSFVYGGTRHQNLHRDGVSVILRWLPRESLQGRAPS